MKNNHRREETELIFGRNAVLQALRAGVDIHKIYLARGTKREGMLAEALAEAKRLQTPLVEVERDALDRMLTRGSLHQGIVAEAGEFDYADLSDLIANARGNREPPFLLILDNVQYVKNFGALLRTAEVRKASAGAVDFLKVAQVTNLARTIDELKGQGIWVVGIEEAPGTRLYTEPDYTVPVAFVVGSEVDGLRRLTRDKCDYLVKLPMWGHTPSLNVSVAGSVVLYEARMQRVTQGIGRTVNPT